MRFFTRIFLLAVLAGLAALALTRRTATVHVRREWARRPVQAPDAVITPQQAAALYRPDDAPNTNPVEAPPAERTLDPLKIACAEDFQNWDDLGCQG